MNILVQVTDLINLLYFGFPIKTLASQFLIRTIVLDIGINGLIIRSGLQGPFWIRPQVAHKDVEVDVVDPASVICSKN